MSSVLSRLLQCMPHSKCPMPVTAAVCPLVRGTVPAVGSGLSANLSSQGNLSSETQRFAFVALMKLYDPKQLRGGIGLFHLMGL